MTFSEHIDQTTELYYPVAVIHFCVLIILINCIMAKINFFGRHSLLARIVATLVLIITLSMLYRNMFTRESVLPRDGFSWLSYLDQNPVHINKRYAAVLSHFEEKGKAKGLNYAQITPSDAELSSLASSVTKFVTKCSQRKKGVNPLNVVIYNVQRFDAKSADIVLLNLQLFLSTIEPDSCKSSVRTFYVFNVADGERNLHSTYIPDNLSNSAILHWHGASEGNELYRSFRTMELMTSDLLTRFGAVFLLSSRIRGPLGGRTRGGWMQTYRRLLDQQDVAVVAPIIACSDEAPTTPELHAYAVAIRSSFAVNIVEEFRVIKYIPSSAEATLKSEFDRLVGHGHDSLLVKLGYRAASIAQFKLGDMSYYSNECSAEGRKKEPVRHQVYKADAWCQLELEDRIFVPWGGMHARGGEYACENARQSMRKYLSKFISTQTAETSQIEEAMGQRIEPFETIIVDSLSDLYRQFTEEERREHLALSARPIKSVRARPSDCEGGNYSTNPVSLTATDSVEVAENSQVCFLVRTSEMHDSVVHQPEDGKYIEMDLFGFIKSLLKQTNPNWRAYLFLTDDKPFSMRLKSIVAHFEDPRVIFFNVDAQHRPKFTKVDGGYTATDFVLYQLREERACRWLSVTNGDNAYGSEVVQRVLGYKGETEGYYKGIPQMLLAPLDSRNFGALDFALRHGIRAKSKESCKGINAMLAFNQLAFTAQPVPVLSRVDLAAMFLQREAFRATNLLFANFSDPARYPCQGCQDGYMAEFLSHSLPGWNYARLPLDGLRSIVFHGPSPTLCVASGNVWYDYPAVNKVGCFSRRTIHTFRVRDRRTSAAQRLYDWKHYDTTLGVCLRLSEYGFSQVPEADIYSLTPPKAKNFVQKLFNY